MKEQLESLNSISINFGENGMMIVNILLAFIMCSGSDCLQ